MRYKDTPILLNKAAQIKPLLDDRGVESITHYGTFDMNSIKLSYESPTYHVWSYGDRYFKLAQHYYNNPQLWWIIAKFNNRPTENMNAYGDIVLIPKLNSELLV